MAFLARFAAFLTVWLVLTDLALAALAPGVVAASAAALVAARLARRPHVRLHPSGVLAFIPHFLWRSLLGGLDVAARALSPRPRLNPGFIQYPLNLPSDVRRSVLAGELSLLPGTLAAGCSGDRLWIHCLDVRQAVAKAVAVEERGIGRLADPVPEDRPGA